MNHLLSFLELLHKFQQVRRAMFVRGEDRLENDFEHSYQLAMVAWYLVCHEKLNLDVARVIQYALVHDLVEAYAGDTSIYDANHEEQAGRERAAMIQLREEFPQFQDLHVLIEKFERREDAESQFVYALDKLVPIFNNYMDGGRSWKKSGVTLAMLIEAKTERIAVSPDIKKYYDALLEKLKESESAFFSATAVKDNQ